VTERPLGDLAAWDGVHNLRQEGERLRFDVDAAVLPRVMGELSGRGLRALTATPPTLEQLLLRHYGDDLQEARR
jgi:ABC-2 type transport system ATP-binding protein